jgi:DNA-binding CsgD family transcriptional regulator
MADRDETGAALDAARDALARSAWDEAYAALRELDAAELTPRDLEGLADASWWVSKLRESLDARQKAYAAYVAIEDASAATAVAARLSIEHFVRDEPSLGAGYLQRAQRHAAGLPEGREVGFLAMVEANVARSGGDLDRAMARAGDAVRIGQACGARDLVAMALHIQGLVSIDAGRVPEGLAMMDEAMIAVLAGEVTPYFTGIIYCSLIGACLELNDLRRAGEWSDAAKTWCDSLRPGSPFPGMCRVNRAEVARLRGAWTDAEAEALLAAAELEEVEPGLAGAAFVQVGEIRRRMGALAGAEVAFARGQELGADPQPGFALLRLAQGKIESARMALDLAIASEHQPARRARLLAAQVEVGLNEHDLEGADAAADELASIARATGTGAIEAAAATSSGRVRLEQGDIQDALQRLRHAIELWTELRLPYEAATARLAFGLALEAGGDDGGALIEYRAAAAAFERLGAIPDAERSKRLAGEHDAIPGGLTPREVEVLRLVASGKTNRDIAVELVISEHTVARHLQNLFAKLDVSSRSAATAFAYEHGFA